MEQEQTVATEEKVFAFHKSDPRTDLVLFVARAVEKKNGYKDYLKMVYSDGKANLIATDGKRLHCVNFTFGMPKGYYEIVKATKTEILLYRKDDMDVPFPDYEKIVPSITDAKRKIENSSLYGPQLVAQVIRALEPTDCINLDFLSDTTKDMNWKNVYFYCEGKVIYFADDERFALIMPMNCR